jgi:hypothetical protein
VVVQHGEQVTLAEEHFEGITELRLSAAVVVVD